jgi:hypothetical protein
MANSNGRGIPTLPSTLIRPSGPTPPPEAGPGPPAEAEEADAPADPGRGQGGAEARAAAVAPKPRRRRTAAAVAAEKTGKRGVYLTDGVWERLQLEAIRKKTTVSSICEETLARNLPRLRIERDA